MSFVSSLNGSVTECADRGVAGFFRAHAGGDAFGDLLFEMELNLVV